MVVSKLDQNELPEHFGIPALVWVGIVAGTTGSTTLLAPGHHPKCRISRMQVLTLAYSTAADTLAIEDGDGTDAATATQSGTVNAVATTQALIAGQYFDRNEAIVVTRTVGNAANAILVIVQLESID